MELPLCLLSLYFLTAFWAVFCVAPDLCAASGAEGCWRRFRFFPHLLFQSPSVQPAKENEVRSCADADREDRETYDKKRCKGCKLPENDEGYAYNHSYSSYFSEAVCL